MNRARAYLVLLALLTSLASSAGGCGGAAAPAASDPSMSAAAEGAAPARDSDGYEAERGALEPEVMSDSAAKPSDAPQAQAAPMAPGAAPPPPPAPMAARPADEKGAAEKKAEVAGGSGPAKPKAEEPTTWKRSQITAHSVRVEVGDNEALPIRSVQAKAQIDGFVARVVLDIVVKNPNTRNYEGTLKLRLPVGASPYYFAFGQDKIAMAADAVPAFYSAETARGMGSDPVEIRNSRNSLWEGVKEARMVPKEKAAFAYTQTVRRQVDPALLEWSGPSVFNARVFPLVAGRSHRIVLAYDMPLTKIGDDLEYTFDLPDGNFGKAIDLAVAPPGGAAIEMNPPSAAFPYQGKQFFRYEEPKAKAVSVRLKKPAPAHIVGNDAATGGYFAADVTPQIPASAGQKGEEAALFLVDTSLSSNPDRFNVWLKLLEAVLVNNEDTIKKYNVAFFNIEQNLFKPSFVSNDAASRKELIAFANTLALEGATDIGAILRKAATIGGASRYDVFLLSDGAATWGEPDALTMARRLDKSPISALYAYNTGMAGTDTDALGVLTRETGGALFAVTGDAEVQKASTAHRNRPFRLAQAKVSGGSDVLIGGRPKFVFPGQTLRVVGRGAPDKESTLELTLDGAGGKQIVKVPLGQPITSPLAIRAYGQVAVAQIEELMPITESMSKAYSIHFRVPGKVSSLLMLESEADYQRFGIVPEDFARTIKSAEAARVVDDTLALAQNALGNPKASFVNWIEKLPTTPGVKFSFSQEFKQALAKMPDDSFRVDAEPLVVKLRDKKSLPKAIAADLSAHKLTYDHISDEAERRKASLGPGDALKALSSLVEENPGDSVLARDVGITAMSYGLSADAYHLFRRVAAARPYEPQTYRAMAQTLTRLGKTDLALAYFEVGLSGYWDGRFGDFRKILAVEYFDLLQRIGRGDVKSSVPEFVKFRMPSVASETQLNGNPGLVVMATWNTDATDVDLHVVEPGGERCFYGHRNTQSGGQLTQDVTQGYGPEMYVNAEPPGGVYAISANYFASDSNRTSTRTKVQVLVIEDYGTKEQKTHEKVVKLEYNKQSHDLFSITRKAKPKKKPALQLAN